MGGGSLLTATQEKILSKLQAPDERGKQIKIGPSAIGGCPYCIGKTLGLRLPEIYPKLEHVPESNYAAWFGTAVHYYLEHQLGLGISESKWGVYTLEGYGLISGNVDLVLDDEVFDYKVVGKSSFDKMALAFRKKPDQIPTTQYRTQQHLYAYALRGAGHDIKAVNLMIFPKHKWQWRDVTFYRELYNEEMALKALARLEKIWQTVRDGDLEELPVDENCFNCSSW